MSTGIVYSRYHYKRKNFSGHFLLAVTLN